MTVRQTKHLVRFAGGLIALLVAIHLGLLIWRPGRQHDLGEFILPMMMVVLLWSVWRRLSALEAEHGPDYVQPSPPYARKLLIALALVALVLGAVAGYLIVTHR